MTEKEPKPEPPKPVLFELDGKKLTTEEYQKEFEKLGNKLRNPEAKK